MYTTKDKRNQFYNTLWDNHLDVHVVPYELNDIKNSNDKLEMKMNPAFINWMYERLLCLDDIKDVSKVKQGLIIQLWIEDDDDDKT